MKIRLTHAAWIDGKEYPAGTEMEVSEGKGAYLVRLHRAEEIASPCGLAMTEDGGPSCLGASLAMTDEKPKRKRSRKKTPPQTSPNTAAYSGESEEVSDG